MQKITQIQYQITAIHDSFDISVGNTCISCDVQQNCYLKDFTPSDIQYSSWNSIFVNKFVLETLTDFGNFANYFSNVYQTTMKTTNKDT